MKSKLIIFILGVLLGWITIPILSAEDTDFRTYKQALKVMIFLMQDIKKSVDESAANTKMIANDTAAIRNKIGAK